MTSTLTTAFVHSSGHAFQKIPDQSSTCGENLMGIGMQVIFLGFARSFVIEAEASVQLVRLARFSLHIADCNLTIEALLARLGHCRYDARLDLIARDGRLITGPRCSDTDPNRAVRAAFDAAEKSLDGDPYRSQTLKASAVPQYPKS
jgi:hypothetical protein